MKGHRWLLCLEKTNILLDLCKWKAAALMCLTLKSNKPLQLTIQEVPPLSKQYEAKTILLWSCDTSEQLSARAECSGTARMGLLAMLSRAICGKPAQNTLKPSYNQNCLSMFLASCNTCCLLPWTVVVNSLRQRLELRMSEIQVPSTSGWFVTDTDRGSFGHHPRARASHTALT